uniref:Methyltransferase domain-containing protein n=1 Tax=Ditylum brightwellii TaxID=49249 RepID=A0A7S4SZQ1_9STRA|mmetsp:Transcript_8765/g.11732  ORF Transcript_8765/g.11732 Transcript_8765/m.11732 type:complete len:455 (-) Transcript_8765:245-1609(-)
MKKIPLLAVFSCLVATNGEDKERSKAKALYDEGLFEHRKMPRTSSSRWKPWENLATSLLQLFQNSDSSGESDRLEVIETIEDSILDLEREILRSNSRSDSVRDRVLSLFYCLYGQTLMTLSVSECYSLAQRPRSLLIKTSGSSKDQAQCQDNAENALRNALTIDATNAAAQESLSTLLQRQVNVHERKSTEFVSELFDSFADTFDNKLLNNLQYKVPSIIGDLASKVLDTEKRSFHHVLDAGCGTGLVARHIHTLSDGLMIGIDASAKMLDIAKKCTKSYGCGLPPPPQAAENSQDNFLYQALLEMDLEQMTLENTLRPFVQNHEQQETFDLIIAADVLVYFGELETILDTFSKLSSTGSSLIFSCERTTQDQAPLGYRLQESGRFAHSKDYVIDTATSKGYKISFYEEIIPRMEKGEEVRGHLFMFVLKSEDLNKMEENKIMIKEQKFFPVEL